jgi:glycosyltransferase involved in cell wall biosynthesis
MNLGDRDIIKDSKIMSDTLIVNQCGKDDYSQKEIAGHNIRIFSVNDTGLTKSRNYAIEKSEADVCLLCDDDEVFVDNYEEGILSAYRNIPEADVIVFNMGNMPTIHKSLPCKLGYFDLMHVASWQISFKRKSILESGISFDTRMGAGTGNGAEEELKFLTDCRYAGLKIYFDPFIIGNVAQTQSTWFSGYNREFFINRGNTTRYIMGLFPAILYAMYYSIRKKDKFDKDISCMEALKLMLKGIFENRLGRKQ